MATKRSVIPALATIISLYYLFKTTMIPSARNKCYRGEGEFRQPIQPTRQDWAPLGERGRWFFYLRTEW